MTRKNKADNRGFVYSTDPSFRFENNENELQQTIVPEKQKLKILLDSKQRAGKAVTLITGFIGTNEDLDILGKQIKQYCGTGGAVKDREIIIQGDQREKVKKYLLSNKYGVK